MSLNIKTIHELYLNLHNKISLIKSNIEKHWIWIKYFLKPLKYVTFFITWQFKYISVNEKFKYLINIYTISKYAYETILNSCVMKQNFFKSSLK